MLKFCSPQGKRRDYLVNPGSKAAVKGIREGDLISSINGRLTSNLTNFEAHGLLKNAGDSLRLGLNEDSNSSPKRRQYRTVHQETLEETVKRSSITTYSVKKIVETDVETPNGNNENSVSGTIKQNGTSKGLPPSDILVTKKPKVPTSSSSSSPSIIKEGDLHYSSTDNAEASQRSYYTNCTISPSSPSILSEDGNLSCRQDSWRELKRNLDSMNDNTASSRSKKRRQRRKNRKITETITEIQTITDICVAEKEDYVVKSPGEVTEITSKPVKSKSLDDLLHIQEVSEATSEPDEEEKQTNAIVSEASESEVECEETSDLTRAAAGKGTLSTRALPLEGYSTEQVSLISPEEEETLRTFLESLHLVTGPEEAANQTVNALECIKQRKAKKKEDLELYFLPICRNPRYLDVISEETSDVDCDREQTSLTKNLKQGTPELEEPLPRLNRERRKDLPKRFPTAVEQAPAVLVDTKIIDVSPKTEGSFATVRTEKATASTAEVVYLTDSSEDAESASMDSYTLESGDESSLDEASEKTCVNEPGDKSNRCDTLIENSLSERNGTSDTLYSSEYNFVVENSRTNGYANDEISEDCLSSQLTPPPTPENLSPRLKDIIAAESIVHDNETNISTPNETEQTDTSTGNTNGTTQSESVTPVAYSNGTSSPPPSKSSSSSRSSSRGSSLCTAMYNPSNSSITDVTVILRDAEYSKHIQPFTLRELCLNFVLTLSFGREVLQELAEVSKSIDSYTSSLPSTILPRLVPNIAESVHRANSDANILSYPLSVHSTQNLSTDKHEVKECPAHYREWKEAKFIPDPVNVDKRVESLDSSIVTKKTIEKTIPIVFEKSVERNIPIKLEFEVEANSAPKEDSIIPIQKVCVSREEETTTNLNVESESAAKEWVDKGNYINNDSNMPLKSGTIRPVQGEWVGLADDKDSSVLVCLSPKQKAELEKSRKIPNEANTLLDLHEKFLNRRINLEESKDQVQEKLHMTNIYPNRYLTMIREEQSPVNDDSNYLFFEEREPRPKNANGGRLEAKDLSEWLNIARKKSMSESNLSTDIPENSLRNYFNKQPQRTRRSSLPQELLEKQMQYLQEKEREIQKQLEALEEEKMQLNAELCNSREFHAEDYHFSRKGDFAETKKRLSMPIVPTETFRQQMYEEYMDKFAEREERKQHKIIKVTSSKELNQEDDKVSAKEIIHPVQLQEEFMDKVKQKQKEGKLEKVKSLEKEKSVISEGDEEPVLVIDGENLKDTTELPKHLREFIDSEGIWSPGQTPESSRQSDSRREEDPNKQQDDIPPVWTPKSANSSPTVERKEFRPVNFQSPVLERKNRTKSESFGPESPSSALSWHGSDTGAGPPFADRKLPNSRSTPASGFVDLSVAPRLPRAQNPTITLLQKAREGQIPKGASYIEQEQKQHRPRDDRPPIASPGEVLYHIKNEYTSESENEKARKMADLSPRKFDGIGPVSKDGLPLILRSEVKDQNQSKWYKRMYDTIHKQKPHSDEYVTVRYKQKRAKYPFTSGYLSEPEPGAYDSDFADYKYQTVDRKRLQDPPQRPDFVTSTMPRNNTIRSSSSDMLRNSRDTHTNQPGRIENYTTGHSSISDKEAKQWWDEVMDIFDGHLEHQKRIPPQPRSFINQALKESGYESDSTLVFRRKEDASLQLSPKDQRQAYKVIQRGGDVPLHGLRKSAPERPKEPDFVEFYPISPTLTKIRIHKNYKPQKEVICYPVTVHHDFEDTFSAYKRNAPSAAIPNPPPIPPPSPPRRRSSRNNPTLRLVSSMKVKTEKSPVCKRHETCFTSTSNIDKSKVNYLKDKITCKLTPNSGKSSSSPKFRVVKKITTTPDMNNRIVSTITTTKDVRSSSRRIQCKTNIQTGISRSKSTDSVKKAIKTPTRDSPLHSSVESLNLMKSYPKTFGTEKRRFEMNIRTNNKLVQPPGLLSPTEVKKAEMMQLANGTTSKKTNAILSSTKNGKTKEVIPIKVSVSDRGRHILKSNISMSPKLPTRSSPSPSAMSEKSKSLKSSLESLSSSKSPRRVKEFVKPNLNTRSKSKEEQVIQKSKKEKINDEIKKDRLSHKNKKFPDKPKANTAVKENLHFSNPTESDENKQKNVLDSNHFFQHLFLRCTPPPSPTLNKYSWIAEKTNQLRRRRTSFSEPSVSAMKVYLKHTKPVTDSKFISLDIATRSRSASPRSVHFDSSNVYSNTVVAKRSLSSPAKLILSQTSRPISPQVQHKKLVSPPPSPKVCRSPSCRRIMQFKHLQTERKAPDYNLYMCPSLNVSSTSLDSLRSQDYHKYFTDMMHGTKTCSKFRDLNQFYNEIEQVGKLEETFSLKPRKKCEHQIIDFDRWREVRIREKAELELRTLYNHIKSEEKEKGFLYLPKDVSKFRWNKECDRGLRVKEKSVDDIKEEFERIKFEESERENARRREMASLKDTYKPLWRGSSVTNIANSIVERRSQSEGRVKSSRQKLLDSEKLLTHGIGSRIWSSLSTEQVNILKDQLADIYNNIPETKYDYTIQVPKDSKQSYVPTLTVRRNSDVTERVYHPSPTSTKSSNMSEDDKKLISQNLSRELLDKLHKQRKDSKTGLSLVRGKETLGAVAVAAAEAQVKSKINEIETPQKALVHTEALGNEKIQSTSENDSGSTDESTKTVICTGKDVIKKKVEYFEKTKALESFTPITYKAAESSYDIGDTTDNKTQEPEEKPPSLFQSKSCQSIKEYFGEKDIMKFATIPLSATRKHKFSPRKPELRATDISPIRSELSATTSNDSLCRSRSISPYEKRALVSTSEVRKLKDKFEYLEDIYGRATLKRSRSESDLTNVYPNISVGYVDSLRRKYEFPAYSGRGRSRTRRGGVVTPMFLRAEDRFMPHINIISKIASLYNKRNGKSQKETQRGIEELAEILGCPIGEVEKLKEKFDSQDDISLVGHMYTSSPSIRELKDIAPYLAADWTAHRFPKLEDNTRSLSSPESTVASKDTSLVRRGTMRPKSMSPLPKPKKSSSILKPVQEKSRSTDFSKNQKYDPRIHEPVARYQPSDVARYKTGWSFCSKPTVSFKGVVFRLKSHEP